MFCREKEKIAREEIVSKVPYRQIMTWWSNNLDTTFGGLGNVSSLSADDLDTRLQALGFASLDSASDSEDEWENDWWRIALEYGGFRRKVGGSLATF